MINKVMKWLQRRKPCVIDTANIELRPCQFCGGEAIFYSTDNDIKIDKGRSVHYFSIECNHCGAHPTNAYGKCYVYLRKNGDFEVNRDEMHRAAKVWNGEL